MKATIKPISVPNVKWKKYAVMRGKELIREFYTRENAVDFKNDLNK